MAPPHRRHPIAAKAPIDPAIFDAALLAGVRRLIPPERLDRYLQDLDRQFLELVESASSDSRLEGQAHKIVSQAGMLGLIRMSDCARALEAACQSGGEPEAALRRCRAAAGDIRLYAMPAAGAEES